MDQTITFPIELEVLKDRSCSRCGHRNFHAIKGEPRRQRASCSLDCSTTYCGHLLRDDFKGNQLRCGDWLTDSNYWTDESPATVPLVVCGTCGKLALLV